MKLMASMSAMQARSLSYAELMQAPAGERQRLFASLTPDNRAAVMKAHMETRLSVHQPDLGRTQIALVSGAIAFVTPQLYSSTPDVANREQLDQFSRRLACSLGDNLAGTLTRFLPPQRISRSWGQRMRDSVDWAVNCVI